MSSKHEAALRLLLRREASDWAYRVGFPRYQADAFGEWFVEKYGVDPRWRPDWSVAKTAFDYDARARELVAKYGRQREVAGKTRGVCKHCGVAIWQSDCDGLWLSADTTNYYCGDATHADTDAQMHEPQEVS